MYITYVHACVRGCSGASASPHPCEAVTYVNHRPGKVIAQKVTNRLPKSDRTHK